MSSSGRLMRSGSAVRKIWTFSGQPFSRYGEPGSRASWLPGAIKTGQRQAASAARGVPGREDALRRLAQIAFGRATDCVRLVLEDDPPIGELDLTLLSEVKRSEKGAIEVRLADRIRALEELLQAGAADDGAAAAFFAAVEEP